MVALGLGGLAEGRVLFETNGAKIARCIVSTQPAADFASLDKTQLFIQLCGLQWNALTITF